MRLEHPGLVLGILTKLSSLVYLDTTLTRAGISTDTCSGCVQFQQGGVKSLDMNKKRKLALKKHRKAKGKKVKLANR